jgi:hypothetical protein
MPIPIVIPIEIDPPGMPHILPEVPFGRWY